MKPERGDWAVAPDWNVSRPCVTAVLSGGVSTHSMGDGKRSRVLHRKTAYERVWICEK